ncbi:MAG: hypothetical protein M3Q71_14300 [Chloroflexota bacterium]|nr:hypothetical protein [Chloroflexota bacterium]
MDGQQFDTLARALATGSTRRRLFGRFARFSGGLAGGAFALRGRSWTAAQDSDDDDGDNDSDNGNGNGSGQGPACREEGHPCEGNQVCCEGLVCEPSGPGAADRCTRPQAEQQAECEGGCPKPDATLVAARLYRIDADCSYDEDADETTCSCAAAAESDDAGAVVAVRLPITALSAEVVGGEIEFACEDDGRAAAYVSTSAQFSVVLSGNVTVGTTTSWWCETDAGIIPALGPILVASAEDDISDSAGALVVYASACGTTPSDADTFDWYGQCTAAATDQSCTLDGGEGTAAATKQTNRGGRIRYGQLTSGAYRLTLDGDAWCHAEGDNLNENGEIVIEAGRRTHVWAFTCGGSS